VPSVEGPSPATSTTLPRPRRAARSLPGRLAGVALCAGAVGAVVFSAPAPTGAAAVSSLEARASVLSAELIQAQLRVDGLAQQYEVAVGQVAQDAADISVTEREVSQDDRRVTLDHRDLLREALSTYVNAGVADGLSQLFDTNANSIPAEHAYEQIVVGDTTTTIARLHTDEVVLRVTQGTLRQQEARDQATVDREALLTNEARQSAGQLAAEEAQVTAQLAAAIAAQRASVGASAAAARSAGSPTGSAVAQQAGSDPTLPPFLQCVVRVESGGDYGAVSPDGLYRGAFQFAQGTWNEAAQLAGLPGLVGEQANLASKPDQDTLAVALYNADGKQPWLDGC